jgi:oligopeptide/dipeptide ABC transporter ATP-binding protein
VIGAGSASFGENTLSALMRSKKLRGSTLALVDHNPEMLDIVKRLAERLNREWDAGIKVTAHTSHKDTLDSDTKFVVSAIEVGAREGLWRKDFEIPLKYGVQQPYAENGGPGGFAHAARYIGDQIMVMYAGHMVEGGESEAIMGNAAHPYTQLLLSAVPDPQSGLRTNKDTRARGEVPSLIDPPPSCPFEARCTKVMDICRQVMPGQTTVEPGHWVRCHVYGPDSKVANPSCS